MQSFWIKRLLLKNGDLMQRLNHESQLHMKGDQWKKLQVRTFINIYLHVSVYSFLVDFYIYLCILISLHNPTTCLNPNFYFHHEIYNLYIYIYIQSLLAQLRKASNHPYLFPGAETGEEGDDPTDEIVTASGMKCTFNYLHIYI
jgi:hypothetical protein